jgi:hypothetical protein
MASQRLQQQGVEAQGRQDSSRHLQDVQRQMQELLQRATVLEAENAQLKSAQAAATAQIDSLKLLQQAEQLKQVGSPWCMQLLRWQGCAMCASCKSELLHGTANVDLRPCLVLALKRLRKLAFVGTGRPFC